ncbi:MAG: hypothetical protein DMF77_07005, partial [Acidobacteria bacterium]
DLPIQYADFAHWQRKWLQGEVLEAQLSHWRRRLAGRLPVLELPTDRPRPPMRTYRGATHALVFPRKVAGQLHSLGQREGVTLFMTLVAGLQVLLHRYTGQNDVVIGFSVASRNRAELEALIGFFVNNLVLRTDLSGNPRFRELLARVKVRALEAYDHQDVPFEKLVEELHPDRDLAQNPIFQVMLDARWRRGRPASTWTSTSGRAGTISRPSSTTTPICSTPRPSSAWPPTTGTCWRGPPRTWSGDCRSFPC